MEKFEMKQFNGNSPFPFFIQYGKHDGYMPEHIHCDFYELAIILNGSGMHIVNKEKNLVVKGDVFVIPPNTVHKFEQVENFRICNIMFRPEDFFSKDFDIWQLPGFHALFILEPLQTKEQSFESHLRLNSSQFLTVKEILDFLLREYKKKETGWQTLLKLEFTKLALTLSKLYEIPNPSKSSDIMKILEVVSYMEQHYMDKIKAKDLSERANLSLRQTDRIFQKVYQMSVISYLLNLRLEKASYLLAHSNRSISEVAYMCGFNDSNYFSRQFHKIKGKSPREYRNDI